MQRHLGSVHRLGIELDLGDWKNDEKVVYWMNDRNVGSPLEHVFTSDLIEIYDGIVSERGKRTNPRFISAPADYIAKTLSDALFDGHHEVVAVDEQWARHYIDLAGYDLKCFLVEDQSIGRLIAVRRNGQLLEVALRAGELDDVLVETAAALRAAQERPLAPSADT